MTWRRAAVLVVALGAFAFCVLALFGLSGFALHERAMEHCVSLNGGWSGAITGPEMTWAGPVWSCSDGDRAASGAVRSRSGSSGPKTR